jgi:hypothetical protein
VRYYIIRKKEFNPPITGLYEDWEIQVAKQNTGETINQVTSFADEYGTLYLVNVKSSNIGRAINDAEELIWLHGNEKGCAKC